MDNNKKSQLIDFNRTVILSTANILFIRHGVDGTTMDEIAHEAGYSKTTIYSYFKSKQDILDHLIFDGMERFLQAIQRIASHPQTDSFRRFYYDFCQALLAMYDSRIIYVEGLTGKILCAKKDTKHSEILMKTYLVGEEINIIIADQITTAIANKELTVTVPIPDIIMFFWFCLTGLIEKAICKENYLLRNLGKDRDSFLKFSFETLLTIIENRKE